MPISMGFVMTEDTILVRKILLAVEESPAFFPEIRRRAEFVPVQEKFDRQFWLMVDAGLLSPVRGVDDLDFDSTPPNPSPLEITYKGRRFLRLSREPAVWDRANDMANAVGSMSLHLFIAMMESLGSKLSKGEAGLSQ